MKSVSIAPDQTVAQILEKYPETIHAWIELKTNCAGCYLMRFCSLDYVAQSHRIEVSILLDQLVKAIHPFGQET